MKAPERYLAAVRAWFLENDEPIQIAMLAYDLGIPDQRARDAAMKLIAEGTVTRVRAKVRSARGTAAPYLYARRVAVPAAPEPGATGTGGESRVGISLKQRAGAPAHDSLRRLPQTMPQVALRKDRFTAHHGPYIERIKGLYVLQRSDRRTALRSP